MSILSLARPVVLTIWSFLIAVAVVYAQDKEPFSIELEGSPLFLSRNDVRIPNDETATEFSLVDVVGKGPYSAFRVEAAFDINEKNGLRFVVAPLRIDGSGRLTENVSFAGEGFAPGSVEASYQFSSYRVTYRYRLYNGERWRWKVGFTGFIRDARIALEQDGKLAEDTDVGFVPLAYLQGRARLGSRWHFVFDFEGLGASQGRAFDIASKLGYDFNEQWSGWFGYRTIEGGADVEDVYNFAWLHFAVASIRYRF
jgi:hypothetical protein